ncbi:MAG: septum formation initiator family protein [bacterium]
MEFERPENQPEIEPTVPQIRPELLRGPGLEPRSESLEHKFYRFRRRLRFWTRNTKILLIGVIVLCLGGIIFGEYGLVRIIEVKRERGRLEAEVAVWKMKQRRLEIEKERLTSDPFTLEKMARERCGLYKPGELIFVFPQDSSLYRTDRGGLPDPGQILAPSAMAGTTPGPGTVGAATTLLDKSPATR